MSRKTHVKNGRNAKEERQEVAGGKQRVWRTRQFWVPKGPGPADARVAHWARSPRVDLDFNGITPEERLLLTVFGEELA